MPDVSAVYLTPSEVAALLKVPRRRVSRLGLPVVLLGPRTYRYPETGVHAYLRTLTHTETLRHQGIVGAIGGRR